jgi:hypothetical protein
MTLSLQKVAVLWRFLFALAATLATLHVLEGQPRDAEVWNAPVELRFRAWLIQRLTGGPAVPVLVPKDGTLDAELAKVVRVVSVQLFRVTLDVAEIGNEPDDARNSGSDEANGEGTGPTMSHYP